MLSECAFEVYRYRLKNDFESEGRADIDSLPDLTVITLLVATALLFHGTLIINVVEVGRDYFY